MKAGVIGAGRIGKVHIKNISMYVPEVEIKTAADPFMDAENDTPNTVIISDAEHTSYANTYSVMRNRCTGAFVSEIQAFADAVVNGRETPVTGMDGLYPVLMAAAATKSAKEGRPVKIAGVE